MSHLVLVPFPGHVPLAVVGGCPWTPQLSAWRSSVPCRADSENNSGQKEDLELGASGSSSKLDSTFASDLGAQGHTIHTLNPSKDGDITVLVVPGPGGWTLSL